MTRLIEINTELKSLKLKAASLRAEARRLKPKPAKIKQRAKPRTVEQRAWDNYLDDKTFCYCCKRETAYLDRAHFVKSGGIAYRVLDIRVVIPLCRMCHTHQETRNGVKGYPYPKLTLANMAWLKRFHEPENWDAAFVTKSNNGKAIEPDEPATRREGA